MSAIPEIPATVLTIEALDRWIDLEAHTPKNLAARLRFAVAIIDRAVEIGDHQRASKSSAK